VYACMKISNKTLNHASPTWSDRWQEKIKKLIM